MSELVIGQVWRSRYLIESVLGKGGMGIIYGAIDQDKGYRRCAIKLLLRHRVERQHYRRRLMVEMEVMQRLKHENIVQIYEFNKGEEENDLPYLVMERLDGETLGDLINRVPKIPISKGIHLIQQALSALTYAHAQGIIHRDLKPDNLFICQTESGRTLLKVLDFGVAKDLTSNVSLTASLDFPMIGTLHYMAPEQIRNQQATPRCDLYAIGVILYQMISGYPPFAMSNLEIPTELTILPASLRLTWLHVNTPPPALNFDPKLDGIITKVLAKDPIERPQTSDEFSMLLEQWLKNHPHKYDALIPLPPPKESREVKKLQTASLLTLEALEEAPHQRPSSIDPRLLDLKPTVDLNHMTLPERDIDKTPIPREQAIIIYDHSSLSSMFQKFSLQRPVLRLSHHLQVTHLAWWAIALVALIGIVLFFIIGLDEGQHRSISDQALQADIRNVKLFNPEQLIDHLSSFDSYLSIELPKYITIKDLQSTVDRLENDHEMIIKSIDRELFLAYLYTWFSAEDQAQNSLIQLFNIDKKELVTHRQWHLYAITLLRIRLEASMKSRLKLALKTFKIADRTLLSSIEQVEKQDRYDLMTRIEVYRLHKQWIAITSILKGLKESDRIEFSDELTKIMDNASKHL